MKNEYISDDERQRIVAYEDGIVQKVTKLVSPWLPKFHAENCDIVVTIYWTDFWKKDGGFMTTRPDFFNGYLTWVDVTVTRDGEIVECGSEGEWDALFCELSIGNMIAAWGNFIMFKKRKVNPAYVYCWDDDYIDELKEFLRTSLISVEQYRNNV